ncbi:hypothetical protein [Duganella levis]|nr:hypothetical protein [Duganella levis]
MPRCRRMVADGIYRPDAELSTCSAWLGAIWFTFQIYFDCSG